MGKNIGKKFLSDLKLHSDYFKWLDKEDRYENWNDASEDIINGHKLRYNNEKLNPYLDLALESLKEMERDGLVEISENTIKITEKGRAFTRNVAMTFDLRMLRNKPETRIFSMTI